MNILVTGAAGFIGSHLCESLLNQGHTVIGIDNFDGFYAKNIKKENLSTSLKSSKFTFLEIDFRDSNNLSELENYEINTIIHLAGKAGVRPSIESPIEYQETNVKGTQNLLEFARIKEIKKFIFASSSSVYGNNENYPWKESDFVLKPISPYASTKVSGELLGHVYSHLYNIQFIGLRFFTVYGPRQRPDLAIHKFTKKIIAGEEIPVFGDGSTHRDYTYVADIIDGILKSMDYNKSNFEIFNLGNSDTITLSEMIKGIETVVGKKAIINRLPEQPGDVRITYADISKAKTILGYNPQTSYLEGVEKFYQWLEAK